jgi:ribonuclease P protein component
MLPKENKIKRAAFDELLKKGRVYHSSFFSLRATKTSDKLTKASFVVSKKVANTAIKRNLLRRRGYAAIKGFIEGNPGLILAFFLKKEAASLPFLEYKKEILLLAKQALRP